MKYIANLDVDFGDKRYERGDEIKPKKGEEGSLDVLVKKGQVTQVGDDDDAKPASAENDEKVAAKSAKK